MQLSFSPRALAGLSLAAVAGLVLAIGPVPVQGCPFCATPSLTLSEQSAEADAVALVEWVEGTKAEKGVPGSTTYEVKEVAKSSTMFPVKKGERIRMDFFRAGKKGDLFLFIGSNGAKQIEWGSPLEITEAGFQYMAKAPSPEEPTQKRLAYFIKYLEFPDEIVANDAYGEFANAPYKEIIGLTDEMPRDRLRKWITSPDTPATRLGLYGMMLGLCGNEDDAELMRNKIAEQSEDFRLGIDGVMGGYLLLTGADGLDFLERTKMRMGLKLDNGKPLPFSETYAAMSAVRFMWQYAEGRIEKDRLKQSMRILLDRPEVADMVVIDLARWKDWAVQDRLMELIEKPDYDIPSFKRAVVRYYLASIKDAPKEEGAPVPGHVLKAKDHLAKLREKDEQLVKDAERFSFGP